jgi:hypothetical protein
LKRTLKTMWRRDGLKCLGIHESTEADGHLGATSPMSDASSSGGDGPLVTEPSPLRAHQPVGKA